MRSNFSFFCFIAESVITSIVTKIAIKRNISFRNILNNWGPNIEPSSTPTLICAQLLNIHLYESAEIDFLTTSEKV